VEDYQLTQSSCCGRAVTFRLPNADPLVTHYLSTADTAHEPPNGLIDRHRKSDAPAIAVRTGRYNTKQSFFMAVADEYRRA
jgi:hypothetical protein